MKTILFPTDFSRASYHALGFALDLAAAMRASITTLHAFQPTNPVPDVSMIFNPEAFELLQFEKYREAADLMRTLATAEKHGDIPMDHILEEDFPVNAILAHCASDETIAVVMGTRGSAGVGATLLGSTASNIVERAKTPVFVVPESYNGDTVQKIGFAMDYATAEVEDVDGVIDLSVALDAELICFQVDTGGNSKLQEQMQSWEERFSDKIGFRTFAHEDVVEGINAFAEAEKIGLLVLQPGEYSFFRQLFHSSVTKKMSMHSRIPLCVLKR